MRENCWYTTQPRGDQHPEGAARHLEMITTRPSSCSRPTSRISSSICPVDNLGMRSDRAGQAPILGSKLRQRHLRARPDAEQDDVCDAAHRLASRALGAAEWATARGRRSQTSKLAPLDPVRTVSCGNRQPGVGCRPLVALEKAIAELG